jgi:hypothetical protein
MARFARYQLPMNQEHSSQLGTRDERRLQEMKAGEA